MGPKEPSNIVRRLLDKFKLNNASIKKCLSALGYLLLATFIVLLAVFTLDRWVSFQARGSIMTKDSQVPHYDVAVVLGTSKYLGRTLNEYYSHRIEAAIRLYKEGKVNNFLLSGDNAHRSYNEPWTMKRDLLKAGVPDNHIYLDYAGFRTLDSIVRAKKIFDTDHFLIISQKFHCERAIYIAKHFNINAQCLAVPGPTKQEGFHIRIREFFARAKAFLDLYITHTQPKFLGPKEPIATTNEQTDSAKVQEVDKPISAAN
nr:ElyC/SanA/YdcF family protein [Vibrio marisflavi]